MLNSYEIIRLKLINFAHFSTILGLPEFEINRKPNSNNIILICGNNGSGKSLLLNHWTPRPSENTNNRKRIISSEKGLDAVKEVDIIKYNTKGLSEYLYKCKIIYTETSTNCSLIEHSLITGKEKELNENGLVTSYEKLLNELFNLDKKIINITYLSPQITSIVSMNSSVRYNYLSSWLPDISVYIDAYKIISKKINTTNRQVKILEKDIGGISIENTKKEILLLKSKLNSLQKVIEEYKLKRMKLSVVYENLAPVNRDFLNKNIQKLNNSNKILQKEYETVTLLNLKIKKYNGKNGNKSLLNDIHENEKIAQNIHDRLDWISKSIDEHRIRLKETEYNLGMLKDTGDSLPDISIMIERIEKNLNEYDIILEKYKNQYSFLKEFNNDFTNREFEIIDNLFILINDRCKKIQELISITKLDLLTSQSELIDKKSILINEKIKELDINIQEILEKISLLKNSPLDDSILDLIPEFCDSSQCGVIKEIKRLLYPDTEIEKLQLTLNNMYKEKTKLTEDLEYIDKEISNTFMALTYSADINHAIQRDKSYISLLPNKFKKVLSSSISDILSNLNIFLTDIEIIREYISINDQYKLYSKELKSLKDKEVSLKFIRNMNTDIKNITNTIDSLIIERKELIVKGSEILKELQILKEIQTSIDSIQKRIEEYNTQCLEYQKLYKKMKKICKDWYYREKINKKISEFDMMLDSLLFDSNKIQHEITNLETNMNTKKSLLSMRDNLLASIKEMKILENTWNPKTGIPSFFIKNFITKIHSFSNMFLKKLNGDALKISKFEIGTTARDFSIEIIKEDGTIIPDASQCSEGEISLLTLAISLALLSIVRLIGGYNILRIDELDSHLDNLRRKQFVEIIQEQLEDLNSRQCLIISHNNEFDDIPADLILFPGTSNISLNNKNIIMDLRHIDIDKFE